MAAVKAGTTDEAADTEATDEPVYTEAADEAADTETADTEATDEAADTVAADTEAAEEAAVKAEATAEVAAEVTALIQEAELHGHMMTVAEAVWRLELERDWAEQQEVELWGRDACGDAAFPQGKQHLQRRRSRKKKK